MRAAASNGSCGDPLAELAKVQFTLLQTCLPDCGFAFCGGHP